MMYTFYTHPINYFFIFQLSFGKMMNHIVGLFLFIWLFPGLNTFKSEFEYYKQIYMNSSNYIIQLQYNYTKMETTSMNLVKLCDKAPQYLEEMMAQVESVMDSDFKPTYKVLEQDLPYQEAKDTCFHVGQGCEMATMSSQAEKQVLLELLNEHNLDQAYFQYESLDGEFLSRGKEVLDKEFINKQKFQAEVCPDDFQFLPVHKKARCIKIQKETASFPASSTHCGVASNSSLYDVQDQYDLEALKTLPLNHISPPHYWLHGLTHKIDRSKFYVCDDPYGHDTNGNNRAYFNYNAGCVAHIPKYREGRKYGSICQKRNFLKNLSMNSSKVNFLLHNSFRSEPVAVTYAPYSDDFHFQSQRLKFPTVCKCIANKEYNQLRTDFRDALLAKLKTSLSKLTQECASTLDPIKANPYIVYVQDNEHLREGKQLDDDDVEVTKGDIFSENLEPESSSDDSLHVHMKLKRQKRFISVVGGFIQSAFRAAGGVLSGFTSTMTKAAGNVGRTVSQTATSAASRFSPHFARVNTFLPSIKKTAYAANIASAIGVSALAIDQHIKTSKFQQHLLENVTENVFSKRDIFEDGMFTHVLKTAKDVKENSRKIQDIFGALHSSVYLASISATLDDLMLQFDQMKNDAQMHYQAYMNIVSALVSKNFLDSQIATALLDASKKLPKTYGFLSDNIFDLVNSATIQYEIEDSKIIVNLLVPVVDMDQILYVFKGNPLPYKSKNGLDILPKYEAPYIAVTRTLDRYALIYPKDLLACQYKDMYLCNSLPLYDEHAHTCMFSHFTNDVVTASYCYFQRLTNQSIFELTPSHTLYYYVPELTYAQIKCKSNDVINRIKPIQLEGIGEYYVEPGCTIEIDDEFVGVNPKIPNNTLTREMFSIPEVNVLSLIDLPDDSSIADSIHIPISPYTGLKYLGQWYANDTYYMVMGILFSITVGVVMIVLCYKMFCVKFIMNCYHKMWYACTRQENRRRNKTIEEEQEQNSIQLQKLLSEAQLRQLDQFSLSQENLSNLKGDGKSTRYHQFMNLRSSTPNDGSEQNKISMSGNIHENTHTTLPIQPNKTTSTVILSPDQLTFHRQQEPWKDLPGCTGQADCPDCQDDIRKGIQERNRIRNDSNMSSDGSFITHDYSASPELAQPPKMKVMDVSMHTTETALSANATDEVNPLVRTDDVMVQPNPTTVVSNAGQRTATNSEVSIVNQSSTGSAITPVEVGNSNPLLTSQASLIVSPSPFRTLSDIERTVNAKAKTVKKGK